MDQSKALAMRCRTRSAVSGISCAMGSRTASTSVTVTSATGMLPIFGILFEALCPLLTASIAAPGVFVRRDVFACDLLERFLAGFGAPLFKLFAVLGVEG